MPSYFKFNMCKFSEKKKEKKMKNRNNINQDKT